MPTIMRKNYITLIKNNIKVTIGHNFSDVAASDVVIFSAAIHEEDPEYQESH